MELPNKPYDGCKIDQYIEFKKKYSGKYIRWWNDIESKSEITYHYCKIINMWSDENSNIINLYIEIFDKGTYFEDGVIKKYIPGWQKFSYDNLPINVIYKESKYHFEIITKEEYNKELILFFDWAKNQLIK